MHARDIKLKHIPLASLVFKKKPKKNMIIQLQSASSFLPFLISEAITGIASKALPNFNLFPLPIAQALARLL